MTDRRPFYILTLYAGSPGENLMRLLWQVYFTDESSFSVFIVPGILYYVRTFQGRVPGMMIFDVDMLKDVLVKEAAYFQNRYVRHQTFLCGYNEWCE